jgi:two-component system NtrC family sensor kinase
MKLTLRAKGILAFMALVAYVGAGDLILSQERSNLLLYFSEMERIYTTESALGKTTYAVSHSMLKLEERFFSNDSLPPAFEEHIALDVELIQAGLMGLQDYYPWLKKRNDRLDQDMARLRTEPSHGSMVSLREHGKELSSELDQITRELRERKSLLWQRYRNEYDVMSFTAAVMTLVGALIFGALIALFLTRLASDIRRLATRALDIVVGYRGPPVEVTRDDEVGDLMKAINRMQSELRLRERQLEISREQRFHKEKMAAIGSLAAAVAHEINNPIAAIAGIAQSLKDSGRHASCAEFGIDPSDLILEQAKRITAISRQIAELTAPHSPEHELLDLNSLVRNTCNFIAYDKRFDKIEMALNLDSQIPAINAIADHLTQVLMNLLINAADALEDAHQRSPTIWVATLATKSELLLTVSDNGKGMDSSVLAHAFDEAYTTKPPNKGRGLGLFLCKSLLESCGNRIELESTLGVGTSVRVRLTLASHPGA